MRGVLLFGSLVAAVAAVSMTLGCADAAVQVGCGDDNGCGGGFICAFGLCVDPNDQRLSTVDVEVDAPGEALPVQGVFAVDLRASPRVDVVLARGVLVSGRLEDSAGGPVDAFVLAQPPQSVPGRVLAPSSTTDAGGAFSFLAVEGLRYAMTVSPSDARLPPRYDIRLDAEAEDGVTQSLEPLLVDEGGVVISGVVMAGIGAAASGVPGLDVRVIAADGRRLSSTARTLGADEALAAGQPLGHFELFLRDAGTELTLEIGPTVANSGYPTVRVPLDVAIATGTDLGEISLEGEGGAVLTPVRFAARVVDANGDAASGATLSLRGFVGRGEFTTVLQADDVGDLTGALPPGVYQAFVYGTVENAAAGLLVVDELAIPSTNAELLFTLPARVPFRGAVLDPDGEPLAGATLTINRVGDVEGLAEEPLADSLVSFTGTSDATGQFDLAVDPGQYRVSTRPPPGSNAPAFSQRERVGPAGLNRDIVLPGRAFVAGTVVFAGAPVGTAYLRVFSGFVDERGAAILVGEGFADEAGAFEIVVPDIVASVSTPDPP